MVVLDNKIKDKDVAEDDKLFVYTLKDTLNNKFPYLGSDNLEYAIANYIDPRFRGCHLYNVG